MPAPSRKHKRGARESIEEAEISKRANMADAVVFEPSASSEEAGVMCASSEEQEDKTTQTELKEMLVSINTRIQGENLEAEISKRANMADAIVFEPSVSSEEEAGVMCASSKEQEDKTTQTELKEMLVDIHMRIQGENEEIRSEMMELKLANSKQELSKLKKYNEQLENQLEALRRKIETLGEETSELYDLQDNLEQHTHKNCLEIHGIPECSYSSTEQAVLKLSGALKVPITTSNIEISHKLGGRGEKPIIVKFVSHKTKSALYKCRAKLKHVKLSNLFPDAVSCTVQWNFHQ